jgi:hypothetical protein
VRGLTLGAALSHALEDLLGRLVGDLDLAHEETDRAELHHLYMARGRMHALSTSWEMQGDGETDRAELHHLALVGEGGR